MNDVWKLQQIVAAYRTLEDADLSYEDAYARLEEHNRVAGWLRAENNYRDNVQNWLLAEKRWALTQQLVNDDPTYRAAARGWQAMREVCTHLDGTDDFAQLSPILRDRYALFARAVLESQEE